MMSLVFHYFLMPPFHVIYYDYESTIFPNSCFDPFLHKMEFMDGPNLSAHSTGLSSSIGFFSNKLLGWLGLFLLVGLKAAFNKQSYEDMHCIVVRLLHSFSKYVSDIETNEQI